MKKIIWIVLGIIMLVVPFSAQAFNSVYFYSDYYWESVTQYVNSPNYSDLQNISNDMLRYCEEVYLEATRRREYTVLEEAICWEVFAIKRQQELDYINYMYRNRGIY